MDPNATLALILTKLLLVRDGFGDDNRPSQRDTIALADEALTAMEDLGNWLRKGGALPDEWKPR